MDGNTNEQIVREEEEILDKMDIDDLEINPESVKDPEKMSKAEINMMLKTDETVVTTEVPVPTSELPEKISKENDKSKWQRQNKRAPRKKSESNPDRSKKKKVLQKDLATSQPLDGIPEKVMGNIKNKVLIERQTRIVGHLPDHQAVVVGTKFGNKNHYYVFGKEFFKVKTQSNTLPEIGQKAIYEEFDTMKRNLRPMDTKVWKLTKFESSKK